MSKAVGAEVGQVSSEGWEGSLVSSGTPLVGRNSLLLTALVLLSCFRLNLSPEGSQPQP